MPGNKASPIPITRLPIFWLFFGPPAFRVLGERGAEASLDGSFDIWNIIRVTWWLVFGIIAVLEIYRFRAKLPDFIHRLGLLPWWVGIWLMTLFASTLLSPAPLFTLANAAMMAILVLASLDLGLKLYSGVIDPRRALKICFGFSLVLLLIFLLTLLIAPNMVGGSRRFGLRARGGTVADSALLSQVVFFTGIYLAYLSRGLAVGFYRFVILISPVFLLLAQTRAMYVGFFFGCAIFVWQWTFALRNRQQAVFLAMLFLSISGVMGIALYDSFSRNSHVFASVGDYLVRDRGSLQTFSARDGVALALLNAVISQPLGLGYAAGPRAFLFNAHDVPWAAEMGNAHNMYLEVLAGSGVVGGAAWLALLLWLLIWVWRVRSKEAIPIRILFLVVLIGGLTESSGALPFYQHSSLLWILAAFIAALPHAVPVQRAKHHASAEVARAYRHP
jgi:O-antigen ligase